MKINRKHQPRMWLSEFADMHGLDLEVVERGPHRMAGVYLFYAHFPNCEVMREGFLLSETGNGNTEYEAIADYARRISGTRIAINAMSPDRKEVDVPILEYAE